MTEAYSHSSHFSLARADSPYDDLIALLGGWEQRLSRHGYSLGVLKGDICVGLAADQCGPRGACWWKLVVWLKCRIVSVHLTDWPSNWLYRFVDGEAQRLGNIVDDPLSFGPIIMPLTPGSEKDIPPSCPYFGPDQEKIPEPMSVAQLTSLFLTLRTLVGSDPLPSHTGNQHLAALPGKHRCQYTVGAIVPELTYVKSQFFGCQFCNIETAIYVLYAIRKVGHETTGRAGITLSNAYNIAVSEAKHVSSPLLIQREIASSSSGHIYRSKQNASIDYFRQRFDGPNVVFKSRWAAQVRDWLQEIEAENTAMENVVQENQN